MRHLLVMASLILFAQTSLACSLKIETDSLIPFFDGSACVEISAVTGGARKIIIESRSSSGEDKGQESLVIKPGPKVYVLATYTMPLVGELDLVELRVLNQNLVNLKFLNGNSMNVAIDQNGKTSPDRICIRQEGATVLKGYANACPRD